MDLVLAADIRDGLVVHGTGGEREGYRPLTWGLSPSAVPFEYLRHMRPRYLYIADLDRLEGTGQNDRVILACADLVERCYVDRGARDPQDRLVHPRIANVYGTETAWEHVSRIQGGYLSIDMKKGEIIPSGADPLEVLRLASSLRIEGCILLDVGAVGRLAGLEKRMLQVWRHAFSGRLLYGGGIGSPRDLELLHSLGYDGAILSTAVHRRSIDVELIRRGAWP